MKAILVNIFGGIVDCTIIANGIVGACREIQLNMPLVVRLEGEYVCLSVCRWTIILCLCVCVFVQVQTVTMQEKYLLTVAYPYSLLVILQTLQIKS